MTAATTAPKDQNPHTERHSLRSHQVADTRVNPIRRRLQMS